MLRWAIQFTCLYLSVVEKTLGTLMGWRLFYSSGACFADSGVARCTA